jgi:heavy metal sensor kinase
VRLEPRNIRTRLTLWFVSMLALVLLLFSSAACFLMLKDLRQQLVHHAIQDLETVEGLLYFNPQGRLIFRDDYHNHEESKRVLERLLEVRSPGGEVLLRNDLLAARSLGQDVFPGEGQGGYSSREFVMKDGVEVELVSRRHSIEGRPVIIRVAYSTAPLWQQFRSNLVALILPTPLILIVAGIAGHFLASRALRPIHQMARKAEEITSERLHERLPVNPGDGELAHLAKAFNAVLVRLEQSFEQLRRFTSDASHELRTPLTVMRSVGEVSLQKDGDTAAYRDVIGSMLEETNRLTRLVDTLLVIARADAGQTHLNPSVFSALELAKECAAFFEVLLEENGQRLEVEGGADAWLCGDWLLLRQALINVLHNAVKYTPRGGAILVRIRSDASAVTIAVADSGPGIPAEAIAKVFDRFYRAEGRSGASNGSGLGLSITQWIVELHGGSITIRNAEGATFEMKIPRGSAPIENTTSHEHLYVSPKG